MGEAGAVVTGSTPKLAADSEPLDVEGYPRAPPGLDLAQVHVYVRHGERTPVKTRMADPPASIPEHWQMCSAASRFREVVDVTTAMTTSEPPLEGTWFRRRTETRDGRTAANLCLLGELTDVGKKSTYDFGVALRRIYVDKLAFLPKALQHENQAYFRSTNVTRTIESLEHIVRGLYPQMHCMSGVMPTILTRNKVDENITSHISSCPQLGLLELRFAQAAAARWNSRLQALDDRLSKYIKGGPVRVDGSPRALEILDTVRSAAAHGIQLPDDFMDSEVIELIESAVTDETLTVKTEQGRRLGMGRLLADMSTRMQTKVERADEDPLKILVYSTHGSTLAALCSTLDVFDEKCGPVSILVNTPDSERWPPFTSSVTFELFKTRHSGQGSKLQTLLDGMWNARSKEEHYVRIRYKNRNLILPMCAKQGDHLAGSPEFCTLSMFQRRVMELTPTNWSAECAREAGDVY